jgi:hypothetical protein
METAQGMMKDTEEIQLEEGQTTEVDKGLVSRSAPKPLDLLPSTQLQIEGKHSDIQVQSGGEHNKDQEEEIYPDADGEGSARKWLAIACYYSGAPYNVKVLFSEMSNAWGVTDTMEARPCQQTGSCWNLIQKSFSSLSPLEGLGDIEVMLSLLFRMMVFAILRKSSLTGLAYGCNSMMSQFS